MPKFHQVSLANAMRLLMLTRAQTINALKSDRCSTVRGASTIERKWTGCERPVFRFGARVSLYLFFALLLFYLYYNRNISDNISAMAFNLGMTINVCMTYMLILVSVTLTLMQDHSGSEYENIHYLDK